MLQKSLKVTSTTNCHIKAFLNFISLCNIKQQLCCLFSFVDPWSFFTQIHISAFLPIISSMPFNYSNLNYSASFKVFSLTCLLSLYLRPAASIIQSCKLYSIHIWDFTAFFCIAIRKIWPHLFFCARSSLTHSLTSHLDVFLFTYFCISSPPPT